MPTIDMPTQRPSTEGKAGFGTGIPTPILLALVGGGIGLIVFLSRKSSATDESQEGTLLPNTAIMLGSLQQMVLDLQGTVSTGDADLSSQLSGVGTNLGLQLDVQTGQINKGFADLSTYLQGSLGTLQGSQDALASAIAGLGTQNVGLAQSLSKILADLNQVQGGIAGIQGSVGTVQGGVNNILAGQNQTNSMLGQLGQNLTSQIPTATTTQDWSVFNGTKFFSSDGTGYTVIGGKLYGMDQWDDWSASGAKSLGWLNVSHAQLAPLMSGVI